MKKWMISAVIIGIVAGGGTGWKIASLQAQPVKINTNTAPVMKRNIEAKVDGDGNIEVAESQKVVAEHSGAIEEILVKNGDTVKAGQDLIELENGYEIESPIDGEVTLNDNLNIYTSVQKGSNLGEVINYNKLEAIIKVDELDIQRVEAGQTVKIDQNGKEYSGKVSEIARKGVTENGVSTFDVTVRLMSTKGLIAGMSINASIITDTAQDTLTVPVEAVRKMNDKSFVMVQTGSKTSPAPRQVETGIHDEEYIEIKSGLSEGDQVVLPVAASSGTEKMQQRDMQRMGDGGMGGRIFIQGGR
ncbi:efflux RND transporter periplasmic adaptor subunit [Paenactinomyces guangxiensis]|uniref:HlyD family efflux transporter periplasmic adaptor subunit n=1 Tax=Paenactinomyces guangxiensis TaxID=1490290 RepID=A0A7W1WPV2_9BACL|nr:HlyD family efflux transporter periplasmic adaptor subunit [Paenactinomyces guangxiensis]MBA4493872.1 HlyD family efflux transporter periplasmic adaptor subunit [Paenactinomyces guangxiensis]MBH8591338.1 HlyD family efflux transporter periplasmic adaptor subunit [Paenactinomyces guangxiensis]